MDKYPLVSHVGGGVGIWPNGSRVLIDLGLKEEISAISARPKSIKLAKADKDILLVNDIKYYQRSTKYPVLFVSRMDLTSVLYNAIKEKVIFFQEECKSIIRHSEHLTLLTQSGKEYEADIIVGADGINSVTRKYVAPEVKKEYLGHISLGGLVKGKVADNNFIFSKNNSCTYLPCANGYYYTIMYIPMKKGELKNYKSRGEQIKLFKGWSAEVDTILDNLLDKHFFCLESYGINNIDEVASDRIYLIGDAAHALTPMSGLAAGLALEDIPDLVDATYENKGGEIYFNKQRLPRIQAFIAFSDRVFISPFINENANSHAVRMDKIKSIPPEQFVKPLMELTQPL